MVLPLALKNLDKIEEMALRGCRKFSKESGSSDLSGKSELKEAFGKKVLMD